MFDAIPREYESWCGIGGLPPERDSGETAAALGGGGMVSGDNGRVS